MEKSIIIRPVKTNELPEILQLCALHAEYERLPFQVNGQVSALEKDIFSASPKLYCLVAEVKGHIIAYATYMKQYATWNAEEYIYLDCLFVIEEFRSDGIGEELMKQIRKHSAELGCSLMQWQTPEFNKRAIKFYRRMGAHSKSKERFFLEVK